MEKIRRPAILQPVTGKGMKLVGFTALGSIWISVAQCMILNTCLKSCVTSLGEQPDLGTPHNLSGPCIQGCHLWSSLDQENCAVKCNDTYAAICEREACEVGCSSAEGAYEEEVLGSTNLPTAPFASSIGSHSITLRWKSANISAVKYIIQWKYAQLPGSWTYTETVSKLSYIMQALHPFTEYVFRVVWVFTAQLQLSSPPSPSYRTHPHGVPETAPFIRNIESSGPDTVEVSWTPPQFPGGPILGYNLRLISKHNKFDSGTQRTSFQFYSTLPNTTYRFFVAAVNEAGEGPEAESSITTSSATAQEEEQWLFLSRKMSLRKRSLKHLVDEAHCLWSDAIHHNITGISVHVHQQVVYFSEGTRIWMKEVVHMSNVSDLRVFYRGSGLISSISTDWLYQRMYFIMNELMYVCDLESCSNFEEITPPSVSTPQKLVADAYNGYIFYLLRDGIYRVDLPMPSCRVAKPVHIVESYTLKDFAIKPQSKRIIYFNDTTQVFMSTFLDGSASHPVVPQFPFADVQSFACENNDFLVTDGKAIFQQDSMSFNEFIVGCDLTHIEEFGFGNLVIFGSSTQPYPVPHCPRDVSVLFGSHQALVKWKPPTLPIGVSPSAWQNWTYEVQISTQGLPEFDQTFCNIQGVMLNIPGLQSAMKYKVSVRASSPKGPGPWSEPSVGTTLVPATEPPFIMAVKEDGLWSKPLNSFGPGEFLSSDIGNVSDMDWYNNSLYYSDTRGEVHVWLLNGTGVSGSHRIPSITGAGALTFEWLGRFLYWAGKTYVIHRLSVLTGHSDMVTHVKLLVNDMAVDSVGGFLYWTTLCSVESTRLNGESALVLQAQPWFSGKKVIALTLDLSDGLLYWLVQDSQCIHLYTAGLRGQSSGAISITEFAAWSTSEISQNALMYYSGRLFWINGFSMITAQEIGQRTSVSVSEPARFNQFTIIQTSLKPLPGNFSSTPKVIPDSVPESSFRTEGNASAFQVLWSAPPAVDWGVVFYSVEFSAHSKSLASEKQLLPVFTVEGLEPYTLFNLSVTPYTYWGKGPRTSVSLRAPDTVPSTPGNPRIFVLPTERSLNKDEVIVEFRWDKPRHENGVLTRSEIFYHVSNHSDASRASKGWIAVSVSSSVTSFQLQGVSPGHTVAFQVRVYASKGPGPFSDIVKSQTSEISPYPYLISFLRNEIVLLDMDQNQVVWTFLAKGDISALGYIADDYMGYFAQGDSVFLLNLRNCSGSELFQDAYISGITLIAVNWISRHLYFVRKESQNGTQIFDVDLEHKVKRPSELKICNRNSTIVSFSVYPLLSRLYWTENSDLGCQMFYYSIINHTLHHILQPIATNQQSGRVQCSCNVTEFDLSGTMTIDTCDLEKPWIYFAKRQEIWAMDLDGCQCWRVIKVPDVHAGEALVSLTVDKEFVYWIITAKDSSQIYQAKKRGGAGASRVRATRSQRVLAYSCSLQPFPDKAFLFLASNIAEPSILNATNTSLTIVLPLAKTNRTWKGLTGPTATYLVYYAALDGGTNNSYLQYKILESQERIALIEGLQPFSTYIIKMAVKNYYSDSRERLPLGQAIWGKTESGVPGAVWFINTTVLSDTRLFVSWRGSHQPNGPGELVRYQLAISNLSLIPEAPLRQSQFPNARFALLLSTLSGGQLYVLKVLACHSEELWCAESLPVSVKMFDTPEKPNALAAENTSLRLDWKAPSNGNLTKFWFELQKWKYNEFSHVKASCSQGPAYTCSISGLQPYTSYRVRVVVVYMTGEKSLSPPESFQTKAGVPSKPGIPKLLEGSKNLIQWEKAEDNGSGLMYYILETRKITSGDSQNQNLRWKVAFNGSCSSICMWKSKNLKGIFRFRVVAVNHLGFGDYSGVSESIFLVGDDLWIPETSFILTIIVGVFLVITIPLAFVCHKGLKNQKTSKEGLTVLICEDKELAELRGPVAGVGLANACYAIHTLPTQEEIENLPAFPREKLTLRVLLGSGAFGEVYEGTAVDILGVGSGEIKVAVKTLKKGSTDQEKIEFLKEAHLMSKFDHPNILKQLGVCLLNEPQYIILELMEGGDLLTYLRKARMTTLHGPLLTLADLVDVCVDVSKGCVYLEQMHFIHRDLAARNCLVSVKDYTSPSRVVKIGDFGLARDIYKNDYYRKRGEGLLPVRWMAPESLMDGIFTTQADVWSFGILVWEILTLGHQPYPAHSNLDVLNYVQAGGRLEPPRNCPDDLWNLMAQCWAQEPNRRPTFHEIQDQLQLFRKFSLNSISQCRGEVNATEVVNEGFEDDDDSTISLNSDDVTPVTFMVARNQEGLNYMVLATEPSLSRDNSESPLCFKEPESCGLRKGEETQADQDFCQEKQVACCLPGTSPGLNYACLTHAVSGEGSDS